MSIQKKIIIGVSLSLLVLILYSVFGVFPFLKKISDLSGDYVESKKKVAELDKRRSLFKELEANYNKNKKSLLKIEGALLKQKETVGLVSTLENIAEQSGNEMQINRAQPYIPSEKEKDKLPYLDLAMELSGSFNSLLTFLAYLEDSPYPPYRLIEIENLQIHKIKKKESEATGSDELKATLKIKVYTKDKSND